MLIKLDYDAQVQLPQSKPQHRSASSSGTVKIDARGEVGISTRFTVHLPLKLPDSGD